VATRQKEIIEYLPALIQLPSNVLKTALHRMLYTKPMPLSPAELLVALHLIQDDKLLKKTVEATQYCFEQSVVLKQDVLAIVLQQLLQTSPLPPLYMRTVIQAITKVKPMASFVLSNILAKLISKQIWNDKRLWEGFVKCVKMTLPNSVPIILQLPPAQFEEFAKSPEVREQIILYQKKHNKPLPKSLQDILEQISNK
jgi:symplekin